MSVGEFVFFIIAALSITFMIFGALAWALTLAVPLGFWQAFLVLLVARLVSASGGK